MSLVDEDMAHFPPGFLPAVGDRTKWGVVQVVEGLPMETSLDTIVRMLIVSPEGATGHVAFGVHAYLMNYGIPSADDRFLDTAEIAQKLDEHFAKVNAEKGETCTRNST